MTADPGTLQQSLKSLLEESQALRTDVHSAEHARRVANRIFLFLFIVIVILIGLLLFIGYQNNQLGTQTKDISDQIKSCTVHTGACYKESRQRSDQIVKVLVTGNVFVQECEKITHSDADLEKCVQDKLSKIPLG